MKFRELRTEVEGLVLRREFDEKRRRALRSAIVGMAGFATSFFVSGNAHAGSCGCDNNCQPTGSQCLKSHGLCYDQDLEQYVHLYTARNGSPAGGCCVDPGGYVCGYLCSLSPIC